MLSRIYEKIKSSRIKSVLQYFRLCSDEIWDWYDNEYQLLRGTEPIGNAELTRSTGPVGYQIRLEDEGQKSCTVVDTRFWLSNTFLVDNSCIFKSVFQKDNKQ